MARGGAENTEVENLQFVKRQACILVFFLRTQRLCEKKITQIKKKEMARGGAKNTEKENLRFI